MNQPERKRENIGGREVHMSNRIDEDDHIIDRIRMHRGEHRYIIALIKVEPLLISAQSNIYFQIISSDSFIIFTQFHSEFILFKRLNFDKCIHSHQLVHQH